MEEYYYEYVYKLLMLPLFVIYLVGMPKFLIKQLNKLWNIRVTPNRIRLFLYLSYIFLLLIFLSWMKRMKTIEDYNKELQMHKDNNQHLDVVPEYSKDEKIRQIYRFERDIFTYLAYMALVWIYVKFSHTYDRIFHWEERLQTAKKASFTDKVKSDSVEKKIH